MGRLICRTAGASHGPCVLAMVEGLPAGLVLDLDLVNSELRRRQGGYGRGARQRIEQDEATVLGGLRRGVTNGAPLVLQVINRDSRLDDPGLSPPIHRPRPGHVDLAGAMKQLTTDCRDVIERASARETAARTAAGAAARCLLRVFGIETFGFVRSLLDVEAPVTVEADALDDLRARRDASDTGCPDEARAAEMVSCIRTAKENRDTVGGTAEVHVLGCPFGLGDVSDRRRHMDARLAGAVMGIQGFKAVEIGLGRDCGSRPGSQVHDPIEWDAAVADGPSVGFVRPTNHAGGVEGGMSNGMPIVVRGTMKPICTLLQGMPSVDLVTREAARSDYERSDVCALPAASVVMEHVVAMEIAGAFLEKFGGDSMTETRATYEAYLAMARALPEHAPG